MEVEKESILKEVDFKSFTLNLSSEFGISTFLRWDIIIRELKIVF